MIKFFRNIRQNLISEGKTLNYLKYAIGEIVLVVIGILIALAINNLNEDQAKSKAALNFYLNTKQQLLDDLSNINSEKQYNAFFSEQFRYAIELIELNDRSKKDTLGKITVNLTNYSDFARQGNIYEMMVNSGDIKLLKNTEIIEKLRRLEETYIYMNRMENIHFDLVVIIAPVLADNIRLYANKVENDDYLFGRKNQNFFVLSLKIMDEKDMIYKRTIDEIESVIKLIDVEIDQKTDLKP